MDLALLIGAGASYGAGGVGPERPPLGAELLERLQFRFPASWGALLTPQELEAFAGDPPFERGMRLLWEQGDERVQRLLIDMAIYFSRFQPTGEACCYDQLLELLNGHVVHACSLNYDTVFEQVAEGGGLGVGHIGSMNPPTPVNLAIAKPHGSSNYLSPLTYEHFGSKMSGGGDYVYSPAPLPFEVVAPGEVERIYDRQGLSIPPAMSLYEPTKYTPVTSATTDAIREHWGRMVEGADAILSIGARPILDDGHIWNPIIEASCPVFFVGGKESAFEELDARIEPRLNLIASTFDAAVPEIRGTLEAAA